MLLYGHRGGGTLSEKTLGYEQENNIFAFQTKVSMKCVIESATSADLDELETLYDDLNDYLAATTNYPGWIKGIYPIREDAAVGIKQHTLFVARYNGKIIGSVILDHHPEEAYQGVRWKVDTDYSSIFVIRTLVVHPCFLKKGVGRMLLDYSFEQARQAAIKSIRLDVYEKNFPAIRLYEKCGFDYVDTVDLGLGKYGLNEFKLYEKIM